MERSAASVELCNVPECTAYEISQIFCSQLNKTFMGLLFCAAESESTVRRRTGFEKPAERCIR